MRRERRYVRRDRAQPGWMIEGAVPRGNRFEPAAIFISQGKPIQQILDGAKTDTLEIRGAARADSLEILQPGRQDLVAGHSGKPRARVARKDAFSIG